MKLNLLPTTVSRQRSTKRAWFMMFVLVVSGGASAFWMITTSKKALEEMRVSAESWKPKAEEAVAIAAQADGIVAQSAGFVRNVALAQEMQKHNTRYGQLYDQLLPYIPSFYRINALNAVPTSPNTAQVTMSGVITGYQQYTDLLFALMRIPGATGIARSGYTIERKIVPGLTEADTVGRIRRPGEAPIPDDIEQRLQFYIGQGSVSGFNGQGGFGANNTGPRGAMPGQTAVTVSFVVPGQLLVPNPRATLATAGPAPPPVATPVAGVPVAPAPAPAPQPARPATPPTGDPTL